MTIKLEDGFYVDENGNKWDAIKFTEEEAVENSNSLINCRKCVNCKNLIGCYDCINCMNCKDCHDCRNCVICVSCSRCSCCKKCNHCRSCYKCIKCYSCNVSCNCKKCKKCNNCKKCKRCQNLNYEKSYVKNQKRYRHQVNELLTILNEKDKELQQSSKKIECLQGDNVLLLNKLNDIK